MLGYTLDQSGLGEKLREKLKPDATKVALQHALTLTFGHFKQKYPQLVDEKFLSTSFQDCRSGPILGQLLLRNGQLNADNLASLWSTLRYPNDETLRINSLNTFKPIAKDFLDDLDNALKAEPVLQEIYNNIASERTATGVTHIDTNVAAILRKLTDEKDLLQIRWDYLHWLIERNMYLDLRGIPQTQRQVQVKLEEVYIALKAQRDETLSTSERFSLERELQELEHHALLSSAEDIDDQRDLIAHRFKKRSGELPMLERTKGEIRDLSTVVAQHDRLLILGDPGCGKTTLLRYLALKHAQATQNDKREASTELGKARFPILLRIADYAEHGKGKSISDFLAVYCSLYECPHASAGLAEMFTAELQSGNCLILLDGLDEIISIDDRMHVVRQIEDFVRHHHSTGNRFMVACSIKILSAKCLWM